MKSERYAADIPLSFMYRQLPPTADPFSKQSNGIPRAWRTWQAAMPDEPAPITQTVPSDLSAAIGPASCSRVAPSLRLPRALAIP